MNFVNTKYLEYLHTGLQYVRPMGNSSNTFWGHSSMIVIYGGTMPTASAFDSGWASLYEPVAGSEVLVKYTATYSTHNSGSGYVYDIDTVPTSGTYVADGTATWAAILPCYDATSYVGDGTYGAYTWGNTSTNPIAMLCDVTAPSGTGLVQLSSTTVSSSAPTFYTSSFQTGV